tara:strand:+ start:6504 stop:6728 length:225 start_codon:yes stop_codon:yes gene_type:complete
MKVGDIVVLSAKGRKQGQLVEYRNFVGIVVSFVEDYYKFDLNVRWLPGPFDGRRLMSHYRWELKYYATKKELEV